jgi:signal transduction histidine kinase/ligand-binding sensor domain-containing protein/DNA-binding response OmpR family regulator
MLDPTVRRYLCSALAWLLGAASAAAEVRFERLTIQEGYPGAWPLNLAQDKQGFLWIADLDDGLIRYDGYEFKSYRHDRNDPGSITANAFSLNVDSAGTLWVGTDSGLNRYDAGSDRFTAITTQTADPAGLSHDDIYFSLVDSAGRLWIGTQAGLNRLDPGEKRFRQYHVTNGYRGPRQEPDLFWTGFEDSQGRLWFGCKVNGGLHLYDPQSDTLRQFLYDDSPDSPPTVGVRSIIEDRSGFIWVAGSSLARLDPDTMRFDRFYLRSDTEHNNPLKLPEHAGTFYSLAEDSEGNLWIATHGAGVIRIAADRQHWTMHMHDPNDRHSIVSNEIYASFVDRSGQVWFAGVAGLSRYNPLADAVDYLKLPADWPTTEVIEKLSPLTDGRIVAAVSGKGLWLADPRTRSWSRLPWPPGSRKVGAYAIWTAPDDAVWISLPTKPYLLRLDPTQSRIDEFEVPERPGSYWGDRQGHHWFGLDGVGLARLEPATRTVTTWPSDPESSKAPGHNFIYDIFEDSRSELWLAHEAGLDRMNRTDGQFTHHFADSKDPQALASANVRRIVEDEDGNLWIHTNGDGVTHVDRDTGRFTNYPLKESPLDIVSRGWRLPVSRGKLWWSTARGLAAFDFKTRKYSLYGVQQGITSAASDLGALPDGRIALSFADRIGLFDPARLRADSTAPTPVITGLQLGSHDISRPQKDSTYQIDGPPSSARELTVPHNHSPLTFEFSALHYASPGANRYAHRLEGLESEWVETDASNRRATYTTLPPGQYAFRVKAANPGGFWSESTSPLMLTVLPPWWQTWWAYLTYAVAAVLLLVLTSRYRTRSLRARATELELQVQSRTRELVKQREFVESQARQLEELADTKDRMMTRISHEFRTPLTVILGPIDRLQGAAVAEPVRTYLATAKRNASRLLRLVDQMLSLAHLKSGHAEPTGPVLAAPIVRQAIASFESLAVDRGLDLAPEAIEGLTLQTTVDALEKIAVNLISNAIKFSRHGGRIRVSLTRGPGEAGTLTVSDTGRGIPASELPHIFEPFKRGSDDAEHIPGSGIGLALVQELVTAHGGWVQVESTPEVGSTFRVSLPLATVPATQSIAASASSEDARLAVAAMTTGDSTQSRIGLELPREASVLVIEDNPDMRDYLGQVLGNAYQLAFASDGDAGLESAFRDVPDLVVCDIMLPGKDGYEICHALKSDDRTSHIPVILLTALEGREDRLKGLAERADDYMVKPFDEAELKQRIANLLALRTLLQRRFARDLRFESPLADLSQRDQAFLRKLARVAATHHAEAEFDVSRLASALAAGERNLQRKLKALLGMSPAEYLREYRLQQAMERLRAGERPGDVAFATGFVSQAHFSKCFRAQFGLSPSEVRAPPHHR